MSLIIVTGNDKRVSHSLTIKCGCNLFVLCYPKPKFLITAQEKAKLRLHEPWHPPSLQSCKNLYYLKCLQLHIHLQLLLGELRCLGIPAPTCQRVMSSTVQVQRCRETKYPITSLAYDITSQCPPLVQTEVAHYSQVTLGMGFLWFYDYSDWYPTRLGEDECHGSARAARSAFYSLIENINATAKVDVRKWQF